MTPAAMDDYTLGVILGIAGFCCIAFDVGLVAWAWRQSKKPLTEFDLYCAAVDEELDRKRDAIRAGWTAAGEGAADTGWSWPGNPADATHGHYEFRPSA